MNTPITALRPRDADGHQFVFYSDACSGEAADPHGNARRLARLSAVARRLDPPPEFIAFPGDAVADGSRREQWRRWLEVEMAWAKDLGLTIYQSTSNHNTSSPAAYRLYREFWADLPQNGPDGQTGLAYWERRGSLLYVSLHQPDLAAEPDSSPVRGLTAVEADWLDGVLTANADAAHKFVAGHYPVFPVNGYTASPWCFAESARASLWRILRRHLLTAYLCSHVLAFDAQVHEGVLQLTSGGASGGPPDSPGVVWGPRGMMPGPVEYPHLVQLAVDAAGLRYRVHDATGTVRESLTWPFAPPSGWREGFGGWARAGADSVRLLRLAEPDDIGGLIGAGLRPYAFKDRIDWLASPDGGFRVGFEALTGRLEVTARLGCHGQQRWLGPVLDLGLPVRLELAFYPAMGPGGLLVRDADGAWNSLATCSAAGLEDFAWPDRIEAGALVEVETAVAGGPTPDLSNPPVS